DVCIFLGLAGAMVPSGMRKVIAYLIENRMIDCIVSTGANLFHDVHESLGKYHYKGSAVADDHALCQHGVDRIYDVYMSDDEFVDGEGFMAEFTSTLDQSRPYTTREYLNLLGKRLIAEGKGSGILTAAAKAGIPVYCPAIGDSALGIGMAKARVQKGAKVYFDVIGDVVETTKIAYEAKTCGVIYIGGGTPKNFIQQAEVTTYIFGEILEGYKYAIQITMDSPQWGGLSGCTFEEAVSWGKEAPQARMVTINSDATIALPIIISALAEKKIKRKSKPSFQLEGEFKVRAGRVRKSKK
ncbi:MAG: deoxyhypusine synthase family protein, partial [Chloroflexi bacterium]|nr:deoxyhypusine synthase family protein [Chloroflexota bacterium]